jgi:hypothetical protein
MIWLLAYTFLVVFRATGDSYCFVGRKTLGKRYLATVTLIWLLLPLFVAAGWLEIHGQWYHYVFTALSYVGIRYAVFDWWWNYKVFGNVTAYIGVTGDYARIMSKVPGVILVMTKLMAGFAATTYLIVYQ